MLGGSGYIEESIMPRLYREAPVNSIWEGSGNVMCLDVLRAMERTPNAAEVLRAKRRIGDARLKPSPTGLKSGSPRADRNDEAQARALVRELVLALQAALLVKHAPPKVADAFCASRLEGEGGRRSACCRAGLDMRAIAERAGSGRARAFRTPPSPAPTCAKKPTAKARVRRTGTPIV